MRPTVKLGSKGPDVRALQLKLAAGGFYGGLIDADFGPKTHAAVVALQTSAHLPADGICGGLTWGEVDKIAGAKPGSKTPAPMPIIPDPGHWKPLLEKHRGSKPLAFLVRWITVESAGNPCALGIPDVEAGIFQTYHPDDDKHGATFAQLRAACSVGSQAPHRALTDEEAELQVKAGCAYVDAAMMAARTQMAHASVTWPDTAADFWMLVKLYHALPALGGQLLPAFTRRLGRPAKSWTEWRQWVEGLSAHEFSQAAPSAARFYTSRVRLLNNAEDTGAVVGNRLA